MHLIPSHALARTCDRFVGCKRKVAGQKSEQAGQGSPAVGEQYGIRDIICICGTVEMLLMIRARYLYDLGFPLCGIYGIIV